MIKRFKDIQEFCISRNSNSFQKIINMLYPLCEMSTVDILYATNFKKFQRSSSLYSKAFKDSSLSASMYCRCDNLCPPFTWKHVQLSRDCTSSCSSPSSSPQLEPIEKVRGGAVTGQRLKTDLQKKKDRVWDVSALRKNNIEILLDCHHSSGIYLLLSWCSSFHTSRVSAEFTKYTF